MLTTQVLSNTIRFDDSNRYNLFYPPPLIEVAKSSPWSIEFMIGTNYIGINQTGSELAEARSANESGILNYGMGIGAENQVADSWSISAGKLYQKYASRLSYMNIRDTLITATSNLIELNVFTGEETSRERDMIVNSKITRHQNWI